MSDPYITSLNYDLEGVTRREIITYRVKAGYMFKEVVARTYYPEGDDYQDEMTSVNLGKVEKE
ncbi:MAG: hypothetical protein N0C84_00600 [Candidatus Thiodiazotropha taylori]|uniref:Uncharacterized protein n=1 Tax=Candidatus Thiodiazotropha taylori TaxID=2792791 RepID=A0A9E4K9Y1_9GAMM|nr:hypothetical protein [Candidatus Thiodiazotropha taylori]MCW4254944.1 hypothetical protein [Candidatus Thiodiazotropha taylori]